MDSMPTPQPQPPVKVREVLESRPIMDYSGLFSYLSDIEVLHWGDHRMPYDLGVTLNRDGEVSIVVKKRRNYYWHTAWEIEDAFEEEDDQSR